MKTYDGVPYEHWMNGLGEMDKYNEKHLLCLFAYLGIPESFLDVGCGTGAMVKIAKKMGVRAYGLDQLVDDTWDEGFFHVNLVDPFTLPAEPVDVVLSIEVAEHIHSSAHATYCDTLCNNLKMGADHHLIFSAARPGQGGTGHVSLRPAEHWHNEFILRGLSYNDQMTMNLALLFGRIRSPLNYYWDNLIVFSR